MRALLKSYLLFIFFILIQFSGWSQEVKALLQVDSTEIKIGQQAKVVLKVEVDSSVSVRFPTIDKYLSDQLEVVDISDIRTKNINKYKILSQTLSVTAFDSGRHIIPAFRFILKGRDDYIDTIYSGQSFIEVYFPPVDTLGKIKDLKEPLDTPYENSELWSYLNYALYLIIVVILVLIGWQYYKMNKPQPKPVVVPPVKRDPPGVIALKELNSLKSRKRGNILELKDFHEDLSVILRKYIQERFHIVALERTSNEILEDIKGRILEKDLMDALNQILMTSDLVKFAKYVSSEEENIKSIENAVLFVNRTKGSEIVERTNV